MKTNFLFKTAILFSAMLFLNSSYAQNTLTGSVVDDSNQPLPGVNIIIQGTSIGTTTDFDGNFSFKTGNQIPLSIEASYLGFNTQIIEVNSANQILSITLESGNSYLDEIIVSASRKPEKVLNAPASVSVITAKDIENGASVIDPLRNLINIPGVQLQQTSANSMNIEMRAGSGVFGTGTFPILDYRYLVSPASGSFFSFQSGISNIDLASIEVIRGAGSALYGPGVVSGIVHFRSKNPIDYPGTTLELTGGSMNTRGAAIRHAYSNESKTFGYKINAKYNSGDDFTLDATEDATEIAAFATKIYQPVVANGQIDNSKVGDLLLSGKELDRNLDGNPMINEYLNKSANIHLEFRPNDDTTAFLSGGIANGGGLFFNSQGPGYTQGTDYWGQARVQKGGLFAQVYYNVNDGGTQENPTFLYNTGLRQVASRSALEAQIQYNFDLPEFFDTNIVVGSDYRNTVSDSENTLYGRFDADDDYNITGVYAQGTSKLSEKIDLTYALRYDKMNFIDDGAIAPRIALIYKANERNTFRMSYNISTFGPSALEQYIDFPVSTVRANVMDVWLSGQNDIQTVDVNGMIDTILMPGDKDLPANIGGMPLAIAYMGIAPAISAAFGGAQVGDIINGGLQASTNPAAAAIKPFGPALATFMNNYTGPTGTTGSLYNYNVFDLSASVAEGRLPEAFDPSQSGANKSSIGTVNQFEVGYKGLITDKLALTVDVYTYARTGFTNFTAVGPTIALVGADVKTDLKNAVMADVMADPTMIATVTAGTTAFYTANSFPAAGIPGALDPLNVSIAKALGGLGSTAGDTFVGDAQIAGLLAATGINNDGYLPIFGAWESSASPKGDGIVHSPAGYRRFGDATRSHYGSDVSLEYYATDAITLWANGSWVSQTDWAIGDDDLPFEAYLVSPQLKYRAGFTITQDKGYFGGVSFQHDDSFYSNQGYYRGNTDEKNLIDANIGYRFDKSLSGFSVNLTATNLFNQEYRSFPGMPIIGRRVLAVATFNF